MVRTKSRGREYLMVSNILGEFLGRFLGFERFER
jgi:hypothetical protein